MRPGEKLFEELFHEQELLTGTGHEKILLARYREAEWDTLAEILDGLAEACELHDEERLRQLLVSLVPESSLNNDGKRKAGGLVVVK